MRKYCDHGNIYPDNLTYLHVFSHPDYEQVVCGMMSVCLYVYVYMYMFVSLASTWTVRWILLIFSI
jgi:hypothetical protein